MRYKGAAAELPKGPVLQPEEASKRKWDEAATLSVRWGCIGGILWLG